MQVDDYPALIEIIEDLQLILKRQNKELIWQKTGEASPFSYNLSFQPLISEKIVEKIYDKNLCVKCHKRISYKEDQFEDKKPRLPFLILVHNKLKSKKGTYYADEDTNNLFCKIIETVLEKSSEDFLVRELLRCHFDQKELNDSSIIKNCVSHVYEDIKKYDIKGVLVVGDAVKLLFHGSKDLNLKLGSVIELFSLPAVLSSGPGKIIYLQQKNASKEEINKEKLNIFNAFSLFKNKVAHL
ncbi:MAG: hypothetical protein OEZ13_06290 [Spirochaetia bacterium]|nr:hypothetical protein [Spirochaetia bacterium]